MGKGVAQDTRREPQNLAAQDFFPQGWGRTGVIPSPGGRLTLLDPGSSSEAPQGGGTQGRGHPGEPGLAKRPGAQAGSSPSPSPRLRSPRAHPGTSVTAASAVAPSASSGAREKSGSQLAPSVAIFLL